MSDSNNPSTSTGDKEQAPAPSTAPDNAPDNAPDATKQAVAEDNPPPAEQDKGPIQKPKKHKKKKKRSKDQSNEENKDPSVPPQEEKPAAPTEEAISKNVETTEPLKETENVVQDPEPTEAVPIAAGTPAEAVPSTVATDKHPQEEDSKALNVEQPQDEAVKVTEDGTVKVETEENQESVPFPTVKTTTSRTKTYDFEDRDFSNLDPRDYGIEWNEEEFKYDFTPKDGEEDGQPKIVKIIEKMEKEETEFDIPEPPSLFSAPEHAPTYKKISELKLQMEEEEINQYVDEFEHTIKDEVLMIGSISLEEVQEEEKRLRDEHIMYQQQEAIASRMKYEELLLKEEEAKRRVATTLKDRRTNIRHQEELALQRERLQMDRLHKAFRRAENQLITSLERRKGEVKTMYGDLVMADGHYGGSTGRRWKVDWDKTPQPIQVKLSCLRGVKDKLPARRYVLMASLYNRLGGHVMRWSNLKGQQWGGATLPMHHDGNFYNYEMKFDQSVFTVLPSKPNVRPGMVLVFEVFLLRGNVVATDRVVGWGAFPICDATFDIIEGKYKVPLLRGEMDPMIDKHTKVEELMATDLDHWLCNLYLEVIKLPRYLAGQKEYEVELQFSAGLLSYPDRVNTGGEVNRDGEDPISGSKLNVKLGENNELGSMTSLNIASTSSREENASLGHDSTKKLALPSSSSDGKGSDSDSIKKFSLSSSDLQTGRPMTTVGSRNIHKDNKIKMAGDSDESDYDEDDIFVLKKDDEFYPVKDNPGMYYKRHLNNPVDVYHKKMYTMIPKTPLLAKKRQKKKLTHLEELELHTFSVQPPFSGKGSLARNGWEKVSYVGRQFMAELGLSQWRSREFWGMLLMFVVVFFIRMYMHYIGQWLFLNGIAIPINKFEFLPYTVSLNYQNTLLHTREEIALVTIGPFMNVLIFTILVISSWLCQRILGSFPDIGSKFTVAYGIQAFLDPFLIAAIDCALLRWRNLGGDIPIGDFAKLYWHFVRSEGSGLAGILITVFLYIFTCFCAGSILYMYFLRLHNNGRMLDVYWRLHGKEDNFFVPYDLELSNQELSYITKKSEQWRGEEGERRKVAVYDYVWEEENLEETIWDENGEVVEKNECKREVTTHVSVHTCHLDGLRELHRHFLKMPDGAIVEVFGDMSVSGVDKDMKNAIEAGAKDVENLMGSQYSLNKVKGRETAWTKSGFNLDDDLNTGRPMSRQGSVVRSRSAASIASVQNDLNRPPSARRPPSAGRPHSGNRPSSGQQRTRPGSAGPLPELKTE